MRACSTRSWFRPATASGSNWIEPSRRKTSITASGPPSTERAGVSRWRATRKRRASSAATFTCATLSPRRRPPREASARRRRAERLQPFEARRGPQLLRVVVDVERRNRVRERHPRKLRAREDVNVGRDRRRVVECAGANEPDLATRVLAVERHLARRAPPDPLLLAAATRDGDGLRLAGEKLHSVGLDQDVDHERAARLSLAVQAVAAVDEEGIGREAVANGAAGTTAVEGHGTTSTTARQRRTRRRAARRVGGHRRRRRRPPRRASRARAGPARASRGGRGCRAARPPPARARRRRCDGPRRRTAAASRATVPAHAQTA